MTNENPKVGIAGLTHLGVNTGTAIAHKGFSTIWFDNNEALCEMITGGNLGVTEPGLDELFEKNLARISVFSDPQKLSECDVVFIAADVPTDQFGVSDLKPIQKLICKVANVVKAECSLVILCQVPPGFTRGLNYPSERLFYQVETLVFGDAVNRALNPERYIIGQHFPHEKLPINYAALLGSFSCPILKMRYESAELAKIAINCCLMASVSAANMLAEICEGIGANWHEIVPALRLDQRIGQFSYIEAGLGISGGNLERDLATVKSIAKKIGSDARIASAWEENSSYRKQWPWTQIKDLPILEKSDIVIGILGLTYKEGTHSIKNSPAIKLLQNLDLKIVKAYDPIVKTLDDFNVLIQGNPTDVCSGADILVFMTNCEEFRNMDLRQIKRIMRGNVLIDPFNIFDEQLALELGFEHKIIGANSIVSDD